MTMTAPHAVTPRTRTTLLPRVTVTLGGHVCLHSGVTLEDPDRRVTVTRLMIPRPAPYLTCTRLDLHPPGPSIGWTTYGLDIPQEDWDAALRTAGRTARFLILDRISGTLDVNLMQGGSTAAAARLR